jgi:two-component system KDP operon response regulator KdpE
MARRTNRVSRERRKPADPASDERMRFEKIVMQVSNKFITTPADGIDAEVDNALRMVCEEMSIDRATVIELAEHGDRLVITHSWAPDGIKSIGPFLEEMSVTGFPVSDDRLVMTHAGAPDGVKSIPTVVDATIAWQWGLQQWLRGENVAFSRIEDLPDEAVEEKKHYRDIGTKSHLSIPMFMGSSVIGAVAFATTCTERDWPDEVVQRLKLISDFLANALTRKRAEQERFRRVAASIPIPLTICRRSNSELLYANKPFYEELSIQQSVGSNRLLLDFCCDPEDIKRILDILQKEGHLRDYEVRVKRADGTQFWAVASAQLLAFEGEEALFACFYDVTERREYEAKLEDLYEREKNMRHQIEDEMNRRIEFTRALAHELKTPLTPILASSDSLVSEIKEERLSSLASNIRRSAHNLNSRIDELLDLAKGEVGILELNLEQIDLRPILHEAVETMATLAASKGLSLSVKTSPALPPVRADAVRTQQVLMNLLDNAIKFTPKDGQVTLTANVTDGFVIVEVHDTGPGVVADDQERIFKPYQRLSDDKGRLGGLGLGLALCKLLVELEGGRMWVRSHPGRGSIFGFSLPADVDSSRESSRDETERLWTVLVIEDDPEIVEAISLAFKKDWPEAALVSSTMGEHGIEMVETQDPDIVILDLGLPDIDGFEALRQIRLFSSVPIVVLTVRDSEDSVAKALDWGAQDYIPKPFRTRELLARMKAQLRGQHVTDEEIPIVCGILRYDPTTAQLRHGEREVGLTLIEGRIIQCLMKNAGQVVTRAHLAEAVWGDEYDGVAVSLRSHILRLRKKLEKDPGNPKIILTKSGIGYSLAKPY